MTLMLAPGALPLPTGLDLKTHKAWVEEAIWGLRFYNDQTPWLCMVELLAIAADRVWWNRKETGRLFPTAEAGSHERFRYHIPKRPELRYLLFRDRPLAEPDNGPALSSTRPWDQWLAQAETSSELKLGYLRQGRFENFEAFRHAVELLRGTEIEAERQRRWTSRHLAPHGPDMIAADYGLSTQGSVNKDRRFFARGGELLFLMLARSRRAGELEPLMRTRLLDREDRWNRLARRLQPARDERDPDALDFSTGYLPLRAHDAYERLAEDWLALLRLDSLPDDSLLEPLMRLTGLAVVLYMLERAAETIGRARPPSLVLDTVGADTNAVRRLSVQQFGRHRDLTRDAIRAHVARLAGTSAWQAVLAAGKDGKKLAQNAICEAFRYKGTTVNASPDRQLEQLTEYALGNHDGHLGQVAGFYAREIGLAAARPGVGRWYAAGDGLLEALVLANVTAPLELGRFLERLRDRYRMVVGTEAALAEFGTLPVPYEELRRNERHLEDRLRVLGLLHRLSDDCAFVHNPYFR